MALDVGRVDVIRVRLALDGARERTLARRRTVPCALLARVAEHLDELRVVYVRTKGVLDRALVKPQAVACTGFFQPARFCSTTVTVASAKVGTDWRRRLSARGSPPERASLWLATAFSRASASETRATLPRPSSHRLPRMTRRWIQLLAPVDWTRGTGRCRRCGVRAVRFGFRPRLVFLRHTRGVRSLPGKSSLAGRLITALLWAVRRGGGRRRGRRPGKFFVRRTGRGQGTWCAACHSPRAAFASGFSPPKISNFARGPRRSGRGGAFGEQPVNWTAYRPR